MKKHFIHISFRSSGAAFVLVGLMGPSRGVWAVDAGAKSPQQFHGGVLVEVQGARPLEAPKNLHLTVHNSGSNIAQQ